MERLASELELPITKSVSDVFFANTSSDDNEVNLVVTNNSLRFRVNICLRRWLKYTYMLTMVHVRVSRFAEM